jgi:lysozyme family protein
MRYNFPYALAFTLKQEGEWSDNPRDPGGATMKGVTLLTFSKYLGRQATKDELKDISFAQLSDIYKKMYWDVCRCDDLPSGLDMAVFDLAVNAGPSRSIKILQGVCGVERDGIIGPATLSAVKEIRPGAILSDISAARRDFYRSLKSFPDFGKGWLRRVDDCELEARKMVKI